MHDNSDSCRDKLQAAIDATDPEKFDALFLVYGLCNNSLVGIRSAGVKTVVPRAHDCISIFMGSKDEYARRFSERPGTYYYTSGWLEYPDRGGERVEYSQKSGLARRLAYEEAVIQYGEENARFLMETMNSWEVHYTHGTLIRFPLAEHLGLPEKVQAICSEKGWEYSEIKGDLSLIQDGMDGGWGEDRFLVLEPGDEIGATYADDILCVRSG